MIQKQSVRYVAMGILTMLSYPDRQQMNGPGRAYDKIS